RRAREPGGIGDRRHRAHHDARAVPELPGGAGARALVRIRRRAPVPAARAREPARPSLARLPRAVLPGVAVALLELDDVTVPFGMPAARATERAATSRARGLLELMGIGHLADQPARELSGGQQRMVEIVRALATRPPLLLLDEPAVGLAPAVREQLLGVIRRLVREEGIAVVLIEHAIEFVMTVSDRIVVLNDGKVIADGTPAEVPRNREVLEAYLGH